jgi:hypothetical protein
MIMIWRRRRRPFLFSSLPRLLPRSIITPHGTTALSVMSPCCQYHPHHHKQQPHCVTSDYAFHGPVMMDDDIPQTILLSRLASSLYDTLPFFSLPTTILWVSHTKKTAPHDWASLALFFSPRLLRLQCFFGLCYFYYSGFDGRELI